MDSAPAPAPAPRAGSMGPSYYGYPSTSSRKTLTRQHRSMDTVGGLDGLDADYGFSGGSSGQGVLAQAPLEVSTHFQSHIPSSAAGGGFDGHGAGYRAAPLSNPIPSNQEYWNTTQNSMLPSSYRDVGSGGGFSGEYQQLKADYQAAMEKLNQTMNSIKTFWSPELKRERQMRRDESTRIAQLEAMLQASSGGGGANSSENVQLRMEINARDDRIHQLTCLLEEAGGSSGRGAASNEFSEMRIRELEETIMQLQDMLNSKDQHGLGQIDASGRFALENALRRVEEKQSRVSELEDELRRMRVARAGQPRDFTDKSVSNHDMVTLRMKMERSELELNDRKSELAATQTRMRTAEEQTADLKSHVQLLKEQMTNREQQCALLQGDVEALRQKLEAKNEQMTQREARIERLEKELNSSRGTTHDKSEQMRQSDMRMGQLVGRIDALETSLREKEQELDKAKVRLLSHPDIIKEKDMKEKIEHGDREKQRLQEHIDQLRRNSEKERMEQQETYQAELRQLRANVENLQKELADRDVLLESQNEKIGDLARELSAAHQRLQSAMVDKGADELRREVENARGEVEKLLRMVRQLEKDNTQLTSQYKQLQVSMEKGGPGSEGGTYRSSGDRGSLTNLASSNTPAANSVMKKRIDELEEALRESVSITAEREVHLSQQKHLLQQVNAQLADSRRELSEMRKAGGGTVDREQMMRGIEAERRQHLEQLLQLKQEALLAAIGEKDAHLALLERGRAPRDEVETIRRHKEALMRKLKQENERRAHVLRPESAASIAPACATVGVGAPIPQHLTSQASPRAAAEIMTSSAEIDDAEGIWA